MKNVLCAAAVLLALAAAALPAKALNPTIAITNLVAGQSVSNADFTVRGTAKGGSGVTNIFYSLNAGGWSNAAPAGGGPSWAAALTLTPGTNAFAAFAQDSSGHRSGTNKLNFAYVVMTPLTVRTNGVGSISPNYDGVPLQIGKFYSMTATSPIAGFGLQAWTDASNNIITNGATLQFKMASNLTYVANMGDVTRPVISITSVATNAGGIPDNLLISGMASDSIAVTNVQFQLNNSSLTNIVWTNAASDNNWTNWTALVSLAAGSNTISLRAVDSSGNYSLTNTVKSFFAAYSTLTVRTNGPGKISPVLDGATLLIGTNYTLTAAGTQSGYGLVTWTDGNSNFLGNTAKLNFVMKTNLVLIANIGDKTAPTITIKGAYTNSDGVGNHYIIWGTAADNIAVSNVFYTVNDGLWTNATSTNNWKKWTAPVTLLPGANLFSAYSMDGTSNNSTVATMTLDYNNSAPSSLNGLAAYGFYNGSNPPAPLFLAFGKGTFSQIALDSNAVSGVGSCLYIPSTTAASALLKLTYTAPPSVANNTPGTRFNLQFYQPKLASFTNPVTAQSGFLQFFNITNTSFTNATGELVWFIDNEGKGSGKTFQAGKYINLDLSTGRIGTNNYTYKAYSRLAGLFQLSNTNGSSSLVANFATTNYGSYHQEDSDTSGHPTGTNDGIFLVDIQQPGGNAPQGVTNSIFQINTLGESINVSVGTDTFSQGTLSTNYDNDVGNFTYNRAATNIGQLNLSVTEPPNLAGSNSVARLIFVSPNTGIFTNGDGTVSIFLLSSITNLPYASITNMYFLTLTNLADYTTNSIPQFRFDDGGVLEYYGSYLLYGLFPVTDYHPAGSYTYNIFSPAGAMIEMNFSDALAGSGFYWVQLNFTGIGVGNTFINYFDTSTNYLGNLNNQFYLNY